LTIVTVYRLSAALLRFLLLAGLTLGLSACNTPRGAAFQNEVLSAADDPGQAPFAVEPVTQATLAQLLSWPATGPGSRGWIGRRKQPASILLAEGDRLEVTVWESSDNSLLTGPGQKVVELQQVQIGPGGRVTLPYIGAIRVAGMEPEHARSVLETAFAAVVPAAQVQLVHTPGRGNSVSLVGGVGSPGAYPLPDRDFTLLALLSLGGGVSPALKHPEVRLMRGDKVYATSLERLYGDPALDTTLVAGDRVILAEDQRSFLSLGAAGKQALHPFPKDRLSALEALAIIGGVDANRANPQGVLILRDYPGTAVRADGRGPPQARVVFTIDLTSADGLFSAGRFPVWPGDLVYATESPVTATRTIFQLIGSAFGIARQTGL
jgi:polysaccharide export outer membrane protein